METIHLPKKLLLKNARLIDPAKKLDRTTSLLIENGKIAEIDSKMSGTKIWDLNGAIVCPGFFDLHVHLREPGFEDAETIRTGQEAAAAGGFSAVACMPNTKPALDHAGLIRWVIEQAASFPVAVYPVAAVTRERKSQELTDMMELHQAGAIAFSDDGAPVSSSELMRRALEYSRLTGAPIITHAEDLSLTGKGAMHESEVSTRLGLPGIPSLSEDVATVRDLMLAEYTGGRLHLAHVSTAGALEALEMSLKRGVKVTAEVTPHHLLLTDEAVVGYDTSTKMKPPLRSESDRKALWEGLSRRAITCIATDHAPHTCEDKDVPYDEAAFGALGMETALGLLWDRGVRAGLLAPGHLIELFCHGPRQAVGLPVPVIEAGGLVELTVFHPEETWTVDANQFYSKGRNCPFQGWELIGRPWGILKGDFWAGRVEPEF
ncbi:MAG: dihydroorotase [bacterium]|nr:dihydroorotase [bacterium]